MGRDGLSERVKFKLMSKEEASPGEKAQRGWEGLGRRNSRYKGPEVREHV